MMFGDEIREKMQRMMVLPMVVLLACGCAVTTQAKELASDKDMPHIVGVPPAWGGGEPMEPIRWSKANKDGVRIVLLTLISLNKDVDFALVVLVKKDGTLVKHFSPLAALPLLDDKVEFIWLNDSCFALTVSGIKKSSYEICPIDWESEDTRSYWPLERGEVEGLAQFSFTKGIFRVKKGTKTIVMIPWEKIEPEL